MKVKIKPLKQSTEMGCLAACYMMAKNYLFGEEEWNQETESLLTKQAFAHSTGANEHFYLGQFDKMGCDIKVILETPYLQDLYENFTKKLGNRITIECANFGIGDYEKLLKEGYVIITLIDRWQLDMYIHFPHYIVVDGIDENNIYITDPMYGREFRIAKERLHKALESLKNRIGYSPIILAVKR